MPDEVTLTLQIPRERQAAVLAAIAAALEPAEAAPEPPAPRPWIGLARQALGAIHGEPERRLLLRLAEAEGRRVPLSELARDLGLPAAPAVERDFPELHAFCAQDAATRPFPVMTDGEDGDGWYQLSRLDANAFVHAFAPSTKGKDAEAGAGDPPE